MRKDGLYVESDLYADSSLAKEVWDLANVLKKNSKTRRLGYSIEGKVVERGSDDKTNPEYYNVKKAIITGCAITHMPKNPKTLADIIKGKVEMDEDELKEEHEDLVDTLKHPTKKKLKKQAKKQGAELEEMKDKALVIPTTIDEFELYDKIFDYYSGISLQKAEEVYKILNHIFKMKKTEVNDEKLSKAMEALDINADQNEFFAKAKGESADVVAKKVTKETMGEEDEDEEESETPAEKKKEMKKGEMPDFIKKKKAKKEDAEEEEDEDEEEEEEEIEKAPKKKAIKKAVEVEITGEDKKEGGFVGKIEKAIENQFGEFLGEIKKQNNALGTMLLKSIQETDIIKGELADVKDALQKAQDTIESLGNETQGRKSITKAVDRTFEKGDEDQIAKLGFTTIKSTDRAKVLNLLDHCTFEKGLDTEFEKAMLGFEAGSGLPANIISRLKVEKKVIIN